MCKINFKRVFLPVFMFCIALLAVTTVGFANTQATPEQQADEAQFAVLVDELLTNHYQGQVNSNYIGSDDILIDSENTYLWKKYSESRVHVSKIMAGGMRDYKYTIQSRKAEFSGDDIANYYIKLKIEYRYKEGADTPTKLYERKYRFIFKKNEGKWLIGNVDSNEDFYLQFKEFIKKYLPSPASENDYRRTVDLVLQKIIQQAQMLYKMLDEKDEQEKIEREKKGNFQSSIVPEVTMENNLLLKATRWDREKAIAYGRKFAGENRDSSMFVIYTDDCTNFVSQCVWAGYGAYPNPYNYETLKRNARNMHLMVPGEWAADSKGALTNWCNVEDFCNYMKKNKTYGPKVVVDNDQNPWKYLGANSVVHGNIVQFRSHWASTGRYTHSALVCYDQVPASWKKTRVVQYTETDRDLWELITGFCGVDPYADPCYMRVLRVRSAEFSQ